MHEGHHHSYLFEWFKINFFKANSSKYHLSLSCSEPYTVVIDGCSIESSIEEVLLGIIIINRNLRFDDHDNNLLRKACKKVNSLSRLAPFVNVNKRRIIMKTFKESRFRYSPLVWMFHSRNLNNKINRIHERALRVAYGGKSSSFQNLVDKDNSFTIHDRNIRTLATESTARAFPTSFERSFSRTRLQLQFTKKQFSKYTKGKPSKIWYRVSLLFSSGNMGHFSKLNKAF